MTTPKAMAQRLRRELKKLGRPETAKSYMRFFKPDEQARIRFLGAATPAVRGVVNAAYDDVKEEWSVAEGIELCDICLPDPHLEIKHSGIEICSRFGEAVRPSIVPQIRRWILRGDIACWASVDVLCAAILGPLVRRRPAVAKRIFPWTRSPNLWLRRTAIVALVPAAEEGELLDEAYATVERLLADREDLIHKAMGWLLREAGRTDRKRLKAFLLDHGPAIPRTTVRYAIEHFPEGERKKMLAKTRG
jgi:3-methyladenine DNA glycosylase AlkD